MKSERGTMNSLIPPFIIQTSSFVSERDQRVHFRRPPRWHVAGQQSNPNEQQRDQHEGQRISRTDLEKQAPEVTSQSKRQRQANHYTSERQHHSLSDDERSHIAGLRA